MRQILPPKLIVLAQNSPKPIYVVGGAVRDFLAGLNAKSSDFDLSSPLQAEDFLTVATASGFFVTDVYKNTGTVNLRDGSGETYEYTCFRSDKYIRGEHTPSETFFTEDITLDAKRRDFTANAVYYDIAADKFVDPLGGIQAIQEKRLSTVDNAEKVFGEDGLRLMRLARQAGQLGFTPDEETLRGARKNATLIQDISAERIFTELMLILHADEKYGNRYGHYKALQLLSKIGVLDEILPELTLGRGIAQRSDFHSHDVLEHSLRATMYATNEVRLAALLHDVGKPYCAITFGNSHAHPTEGARIADEILHRLKAPKRLTKEVKELILYHMYDFDLQAKENRVRKFIVEHYALLEKLLAVKQADFSGCKDDLSTCPTAIKWQAIIEKMKGEKAPFTLKQLALNGKDLADNGYPAPYLSKILNKLLLLTAVHPKENKKFRLLKHARGIYNELQKENLT
jgi:tRNA nucleotidyltransferase (CCA-adding enzyme)